MREIKFRAWDVADKEMREVAMLRWENGRMSRIAGYWKGTRDNGWTDYDPADDKYILMQFTGLLDKNGKEIYEGDVIVQMASNYRTNERLELRRQVVKIEPFYFADYEDSCAGSGFMLETCSLEKIEKEWEIIGNIYENPELIKSND